MKKFLLRALFFLVPFLYSIYVCSQPGKERDCGTTCFSSEVVSVEKISATCTSYELKVSYSGKCAHALSHFTVEVPCGKIQDLWNSENWKQVLGTDPTTGLTGFKIDDIPNFGETATQSFRIRFTVCSLEESCAGELDCWQPLVAYKAATCVNYDTLAVSCRNLKAFLQKQDVSCFGAQDGSLAVVIEEGREPLTYLWSDSSAEQSLSGLSAGHYSVVIRDASGAELMLQDSIRQPEEIKISGTTIAASCNGLADGSIDLTVSSGGAGNYTFLWSNGADTEDIHDLPSGNYSVKVTDARGCSATSAFSIGNKANIRITSAQARPDCNDANGSIDLSVTGGTSPYTFNWSNGNITEDLENLGAGLYSVTVTDSAGCFEKASFFLRENNTLLLTGSSTPTSCSDDASGKIDLSVSGGSAPYSFSWSNAEATEDITHLTSGYYTVTVTDAKGCTATAGFTVSKETFQVSSTIEKPSCHNGTDGSITLQEPVGGTAPYTYEWSNGETGTFLTNLDPGVYSVTVTDATGCSRTLTFTLNNPQEILASATVSNQECNAEGFFSIDLTVSGGTPPYTFNWPDGSSTEDMDSLQSGSYTVIVTDARGCSISKEVTVESQDTPWSCLIDGLADMPACGSVDNELSSSVTGADSYVWTVTSTDGGWSITSGDSSSILFTAGEQTSSATFTLTIEKDGCTKTCSYTVSSCTPGDNGGGTDPGGEDPGQDGDQTCEECFSTAANLIKDDGTCRTYEMQVRTTGLCRHELSHWTLAIPCGTVSNYSNSEGWKMVYGQDPTTGLYGLKVDDINGFGKEVDSFTVKFTICENGNCDLAGWDPTVAYKAGLCVGVETIDISETSSTVVSVYPNPFEETINFEWKTTDENADLQILDQYGNTVWRTTRVSGKGEGYSVTLDSSPLPGGMYYYRLTIAGKTFSGKISKR